MYIIPFLVILIVLIYQNSRISELEIRIKNGVLNSQPKQPASSPAHSPASVDLSHTPITPEVSPAYVPPVITPQEKAKNDISGEEASGRFIGRIGIAAVIIGMAFFLKYAFDNNWIGPAGRVAIGILIGICVMAVGQYLRKKYLQYSDLLMGGGLAILYLSVFASYALYNLVSPMMAFLGMIIVTAIGVFISIMNATITLAFVAFIGGFLAPELIGVTSLGEFVTFTYITILNIGILGILLYKKWTNLVLCGLIGTWFIFGSWIISSYTKDMLVPTLFFILVQFLIFTASTIYRIIAEKIKAAEIDYFVLATTALSFSIVCYQLLMPEYKHFVSFGAVVVAGFYILIALLAHKENPTDRTLNVFLPGLAVTFLTIAVPIEFSGPWITAWWLIEALVLYAIASTSASRGFQIMGVIVYSLGIANLSYYLINYVRPSDFVILFNGPFIMLMMAVFVSYAISFVYYRYGSTSKEVQQQGIVFFIVAANIITVYALTTQVIAYYELQQVGNITSSQITNWSNTSVSILWVVYAAFLTMIGFAKRFTPFRYMGLVLFVITAIKIFTDVWSLGPIYRIVSFIIFGLIALITSFIYVKYRARLHESQNQSA